MRSLGAVWKTVIAVGLLLAMSLAMFFVVERGESGKSGEAEVAPRLNPTSVETFWGFSIDGRKVPCFTVAKGSTGVAITCDWSVPLTTEK